LDSIGLIRSSFSKPPFVQKVIFSWFSDE
jgi:hypothetical protein